MHVGIKNDFYFDFIIDLLSIHSDEENMSILLLPHCSCMPRFNSGHFVVSEQSSGEKTALSIMQPTTHPHT